MGHRDASFSATQLSSTHLWCCWIDNARERVRRTAASFKPAYGKGGCPANLNDSAGPASQFSEFCNSVLKGCRRIASTPIIAGARGYSPCHVARLNTSSTVMVSFDYPLQADPPDCLPCGVRGCVVAENGTRLSANTELQRCERSRGRVIRVRILEMT
jgi:hypothetical protein